MNDGVSDSPPATSADRAGSFGDAARAYAQHRPGYPAAAVAWALAPVPDPGVHIVDLGAGTGKLTESLFPLAGQVTAVEPDVRMRAEFARAHPDTPILNGRGERIPLPDASVDAVVAGQAFHWFDAPVALTEIARVLRPGGVVAALWNYNDDTQEWVAGFDRLAGPAKGRAAPDAERPAHPAFTPFERAAFPHAHRRTLESLLDTVATHSWLLVADPDERASRLATVREYLAGTPETAHGEFELPLTSTVLRAVRR